MLTDDVKEPIEEFFPPGLLVLEDVSGKEAFCRIRRVVKHRRGVKPRFPRLDVRFQRLVLS